MSKTTVTERIIEIAAQNAAGRPLAEQVAILTDCIAASKDPQAAMLLAAYRTKLQATNQLIATFSHAEYRDQI